MTLGDDALRRAFAGVNLPSDAPPTAEEIQAALDGVGDESARLATLARLTATPEGRAELNLIRALRDGFAPAGAVTPRAADATQHVLRRAPRWNVWAGLAAAVVLVTVTLVKRAVPREDAGIYRSTQRSLALVSPEDGAVASGTPVFSWQPVDGASYEFELFTADGMRIARIVTTDSVLSVSPPVPTGDYRWWVTARLDDATQVRSGARRLLVK